MNEEQADKLINVLQNIQYNLDKNDDVNSRLTKMKGRLANYCRLYLKDEAEKKYIESIIEEHEMTWLPKRKME